ncbi:uncharacterized protein PHALS_09579 [Plasmopara halstedii]|uniref:Uncharacterized protein n=1 Tax=Plasmopara halstedii TaxID=4781 RepID=A0A0P1AFW9_PLAHL|nr:uncharacterized protein PHALS_09579 [Plasmopara halstedii]CEG39325.1 hypothetical protein PHALS_09579 [Plasmopara halstedii]|eukprot:XP_024575694.1 hypothetical protein PHALS_09579 [Plasmopara halstedii]
MCKIRLGAPTFQLQHFLYMAITRTPDLDKTENDQAKYDLKYSTGFNRLIKGADT